MMNQLKQYGYLMRLDKPIGILLLWWPTAWALWLAGAGHPSMENVMIFMAGVLLMRSAGCVVNDMTDRDVDGHVSRTRHRPIVSGKVSMKEAMILAACLALIAFGLVLFCNRLTVVLACVGALLTVIYPRLKRVTHLPQVGLGVAFAWGVPMAFAAETGQFAYQAWPLWLAALLWSVIYDTMYAMVDRKDDVAIGVKSTAILFGRHDVLIISLLQIVLLFLLIIVGQVFHLNAAYYFSLCVTAGFFGYQLWLIKNRNEKNCFAAFLNNQWVGFVVFLGIWLGQSS